tara:strand:- start:7709 stop:8533 length:825 start_codon:yes stop_codon:yes gene_type:complete
MSNEFVVLHYQDGSSDKIWAINKVANADNSHTVWFGRRGTKLQSKKVGYKTWSSLMQSKLDKGYHEVENVTIDVENSVVVPFLQATEESEELPDALWYRVSNQVPVNVIRDYLNITIQLVSEHSNEELERLIQLPTYKALYAGKKSGGADYTEGPLALLLLFGLRRYLNDVAGSPLSTEIMQIANDGSELLPERFADIEDYVRSYAIGLFEHNGWFGNRTSGDWKEYVDGVARQHNLSHYTSVIGIKPLAIVMGCIDAPIDLTVIRTETKAAFF